MRRTREILAFVAVLVMNFGLFGGIASAQQLDRAWSCRLDESLMEDTAMFCDAGVVKEVSVNGGAFVDANSSVATSSAVVGDTVTWRITLEDLSMGGYVPAYMLQISDVLPAGFLYLSHTASEGSFADGVWELPVSDYDFETDTYTYLLPAILEIRSQAQTVGLWENVAAIKQMNCDGWCSYGDDNAQNDSDPAFVPLRKQTTPQVLGSSTTTNVATPQVLAATGDRQVLVSVFAGVGLLAVSYVLYRVTLKSKEY